MALTRLGVVGSLTVERRYQFTGNRILLALVFVGPFDPEPGSPR
jgi:hypothetical protein